MCTRKQSRCRGRHLHQGRSCSFCKFCTYGRRGKGLHGRINMVKCSLPICTVHSKWIRTWQLQVQNTPGILRRKVCTSCCPCPRSSRWSNPRCTVHSVPILRTPGIHPGEIRSRCTACTAGGMDDRELGQRTSRGPTRSIPPDTPRSRRDNAPPVSRHQ